MPKHSPHIPEQRTEIILAHLRNEEPATVLCRRHNISDSTLARWREEFLAGGTAALGAGKCVQNSQTRRIEELEHALAGRDQVIGELTIANRIQKKTASRVNERSSIRDYRRSRRGTISTPRRGLEGSWMGTFGLAPRTCRC